MSKVGISFTRHTEEAEGLLSLVSVRSESFLDHKSERLAGTENWIHLVGHGLLQAAGDGGVSIQNCLNNQEIGSQYDIFGNRSWYIKIQNINNDKNHREWRSGRSRGPWLTWMLRDPTGVEGESGPDG